MRLIALALAALLCVSGATAAEPVPVRFREGLVHGYLVLRASDGEAIADGELLQSARGDRVTSRLTFHFKDGSLHDEVSVFSQRDTLQLLTNHLVQKGPAFKRPIEAWIDVPRGTFKARYTEDDGDVKTIDESVKLPRDLANGLIMTALKNLPPGTSHLTLSMLAITPKPRVVKLQIESAGEQSFTFGGATRKATHYVVKVDIGGLTEVFAELTGKVPPDSHVWIQPGEAPAFVRSESPFFAGGPLWRVELTSPMWPEKPARPVER